MKRGDFGKIILGSLLLSVIMILTVAPVMTKAAAAGISDDAVIVLSPSVSGNEITVDAVLKQNTALSGMTLEIVYDTSAMTLTNVERGEALSALDYMTTNPNTEKGYSFTPFKINWMRQTEENENDFSTGVVVRLFFTIKENVEDGEYLITFETERDKSATYFGENGAVETKNVLVDGAKIQIKNNIPAVINEEPKEKTDIEEKKPNIALIAVLCVVGVAAVTGGIVLLVRETGRSKGKNKRKGKKKSWEKVK